jgi:hypothetical protein
MQLVEEAKRWLSTIVEGPRPEALRSGSAEPTTENVPEDGSDEFMFWFTDFYEKHGTKKEGSKIERICKQARQRFLSGHRVRIGGEVCQSVRDVKGK